MQSPQIVEFVNFMERLANGPYYYWTGAGRCDPLNSGYADCSGSICSALRHVGVDIECTGSFMLARICHAHGTGISLDEARRTRGALVFIGINEGQGGRPGIDPGHIAVSRGDGTVVEARNRRAGILYGSFDNRGWRYAALPAWFPATADGSQPTPTPGPTPPPPSPPPPPPRKETMLFISPNFGSDKFHPHAAAVIGDLLRVFDTKTNPFREGTYKEFGSHVRFIDLGLAAGEVPLVLGDKDERGKKLAADHLICWTLMGDGTTLSRHDLHWVV